MLLNLLFIVNIIIGSDFVKLIVGLGNPGRKYFNTRHNIGFEFIDFYLNNSYISEKWKNLFDGKYIEFSYNNEKIIFLKPQTFMNLSGDCVGKFFKYFKLNIEDILVISDDLDLNLGNFKIKDKGSSGGHNGLKSIEKALGSNNYKRIKIGISKCHDKDVIDYVLGKFSDNELNILKIEFPILKSVLDDYFNMDFSLLMNKYNHKNR